jgi:chromosomal replication initiator protein
MNHLEQSIPSTPNTTTDLVQQKTFWGEFLSDAGKEMSSSQFRTWIKPLAPLGFDQDNFIL